MAKKFYWLKLENDFFRQKEIKKLRKIAGGDTYTIIYLKMLLISLENNGKIYFEGIEENFAEEISLELDEDVSNVKMAIGFLFSHNLLCKLEENEFEMTRCSEMVGSETDSAKRMRKLRGTASKLVECDNKPSPCDNDVTQQLQPVTKSDIEKRREELELEKEKELDKEKKIPYQLIADDYNSICKSFPKLQKLSDKRKKAIKIIAKQFTNEEIKQAFIMAEQSDFLTGRIGKGFSAGFDWIMTTGNMTKIIEGNYKNKGGDNSGRSASNNGKDSKTAEITEDEGERLAKRAIEKFGGKIQDVECDF